MNEDEIFNAAVKLSRDERGKFLDLACKGNPELRGQVEALLKAHFDSATILHESDEKPQDRRMMETMASERSAEHPGTIIAGRYKLIEAIGAGGMGSVWLAEQKVPVKRNVAIKLIKAGMDSRQVLARFDAERQALAMMDHPNIAKVFDGGMTDQGRPYFVMEYVKGVPLTEYCDRIRLSLKERLQLFMSVCGAVQHAHQKGIIHRDLKPSNILICLYDGKPVPKVIDFGLAKAMYQSLTEQSLHTAEGIMVGTPLYMSPEQAEHNNLDVDTRSDIYSLGVILYELLTGSTPLERRQMKQAAFNEILRLIKEVEPPKPSTRLSSSNNLPSIAAQRNIEPSLLKRSLAGDLDWIAMKALDKERNRRYETANGLAADVLRHLAGEPVLAAPPNAIYRFQKFVRRNKGKVLAASLVLFALLAGIAGTSWQWYRANQSLVAEAIQRTKAEDNERRATVARAEALAQQAMALEQEAEAKKQAAIAEAVVKFQNDMFAAVDPELVPRDPVTKEELKDRLTVVQAMAAAVKLLDEGSLKDQPLVEARVRDTIGMTLEGLGRFEDAEPILRKSLAIRRAALPAGHPEIADSLNNLAGLLQEDQNRSAEAESLYGEALEIHRAALPAEHPDIANDLNDFALLLLAQNRLEEAEPLFRETLDIYRRSRPAGHPDIAVALSNLALLLKAKNKLAEAEPLYRESLEICRAAYPAGHPHVASALNNLATLLGVQKKFDEAEVLQREALDIRRAILPAGHSDIATTLNNLSVLLRGQNKIPEAERHVREALGIRRVALPVGHPDIANTLNNLASLLKDQNKLAEAEPFIREALEIRRAALPAGHPRIATSLNNLATLMYAQKKLAEAEPLVREALEIRRAALPAGHPDIADSLNSLARLLRAQSKLAEAEPFQREALETIRAALPAEHPDIAKALDDLASLLLDQSKPNEAEPLLGECLAIREKVQPDAWTTFNTKSMLGGALLVQKKYTESEPLLLASYEGLKQRETTIPEQGKVRLSEALERLVQIYTDWHAAEPDQGYDAKAAEWQQKLDEHNAALATEKPASAPEK